MILISTTRAVITVITVFTVDPARQQPLMELLATMTESSVVHAPGFVSASLHRSIDGTKVTAYGQWRTVEDYQAMRFDTASLAFLDEVRSIARFESCLYDVWRTFVPEGSHRG